MATTTLARDIIQLPGDTRMRLDSRRRDAVERFTQTLLDHGAPFTYAYTIRKRLHEQLAMGGSILCPAHAAEVIRMAHRDAAAMLPKYRTPSRM